MHEVNTVGKPVYFEGKLCCGLCDGRTREVPCCHRLVDPSRFPDCCATCEHSTWKPDDLHCFYGNPAKDKDPYNSSISILYICRDFNRLSRERIVEKHSVL